MSHDILVYLTLLKNRLGRPPAFDVSGPESLAEIAPDPVLKGLHTVANPSETQISNVPAISCSSTNTEAALLESRGMRHREGGWPTSVDPEEAEERTKYCRRAAREERALHALVKLVPPTVACLRMNAALDIYGMFFDDDGPSALDGRLPVGGAKGAPAEHANPGGTGAPSGNNLQPDGTVALPPLSDGVDIPYNDPSVVHALHVYCKLSHPRGVKLHGLAACRSCFTCDGESGRVVVGYSEPVLPSRMLTMAAAGPSNGGLGNAGAAARMSLMTNVRNLLETAPLAATMLSNQLSLSGTNTLGLTVRTPRRSSYFASGEAAEFAARPVGEEACAGALWSLSAPGVPLALLFSRSGGCTAMAASYKDPHIVLGGMSSGVVELWDTRTPGTAGGGQPGSSSGLTISKPGRAEGSDSMGGPHCRPVQTTRREVSHADAITDLRQVATKASEVVTCGLDGKVLFWDARRLDTPIEDETVILSDPRTSGRYAATALDYDPLVGGTLKFLVSTAEGRVLSCIRRGRSATERVAATFDCHYSACLAAARCPALPKVFMTCGDWGFKLMADELKGPLLCGPVHAASVLCGLWHPQRPSVLIYGTSSGDLLLWDYLYSAARPAMRIRASSAPLRHITTNNGVLLATDGGGEVHVVALPGVLRDPLPQERARMAAALEREFARARLVQAQEAPRHSIMHNTSGVFASSRTNATNLGQATDIDADQSENTEETLDIPALTRRYFSELGVPLRPPPACRESQENTDVGKKPVVHPKTVGNGLLDAEGYDAEKGLDGAGAFGGIADTNTGQNCSAMPRADAAAGPRDPATGGPLFSRLLEARRQRELMAEGREKKGQWWQ